MTDDSAVQVAVVLQLLGRSAAYPRTDLLAALAPADRKQVNAALASLAEVGVVELDSRGVRATEAVRRLDELGLIPI